MANVWATKKAVEELYLHSRVFAEHNDKIRLVHDIPSLFPNVLDILQAKKTKVLISASSLHIHAYKTGRCLSMRTSTDLSCVLGLLRRAWCVVAYQCFSNAPVLLQSATAGNGL